MSGAVRRGTFAIAACLATAGALGFAVAADAGEAPTTVSIRFGAEVAGAPFRCGLSYANIGLAHARVTPTDFRFYVSDVALIDRNGRAAPVALAQDGIWQYRNVALLDFEDGTGPCGGGNSGLNDRVRGEAAKGDYVGVRFTLGLPFDLNHGDGTTAPAPLDQTAMFWTWQAGYRFLKVDLAGDAAQGGQGASGYAAHLGDTGCVGPGASQRPTNCAHRNQVVVTFVRFDANRDVVVGDLARLLANVDTTRNAPGTAPGCMAAEDDPDCAGLFAALGLAFGNAPARAQTFFAVKHP